jgi:DNA-binding MarR family transcriptional regulator
VLGDKFDRNITTKQWLFILGVSRFEEPPTVSEVANFIGYSRQNAKRIAADLHKIGYVSITSDKNDARALRIALTSKCMEYFKERDRREIEFLEKIFTGFDVELTGGFYNGVSRLAQNIQALMNDDGYRSDKENHDEKEE